jgi:hypothetical protein
MKPCVWSGSARLASLVLLVFLVTVACTVSPLLGGQSQDDNTISATLSALASQNHNLAIQVATLEAKVSQQEEIITYLATRAPGQMPEPVADDPTPHRPIRGIVLLEDGACCAGGIAGETIQVSAHFEAGSPLGAINEMRILAGMLTASEEQMEGAEWEPFAPEKTFDVVLAINWVGYYVNVQFRDSAGNISAVFMDDISLEGAPEQND